MGSASTNLTLLNSNVFGKDSGSSLEYAGEIILSRTATACSAVRLYSGLVAQQDIMRDHIASDIGSGFLGLSPLRTF